ncbi:MmgE/PrpD family protein [Burkholderia sp. WAC0059]|uniref:MmgE/PrpD family protein n=1 Tax=Burkholderia sp. WAC0059 TaxID=2066022 RepID=UPI000C7EF601|nr:MmgE/PrpD family protein [Burkholderia sp. WAC0059]PLZ00475.1 MmgE/PrpD family protein [Burkholderia sp. WAC0059]
MQTVEATASAHVAQWATGVAADAIPPAIRARAQTCLIDTIGVAIAGSRSEAAGFARALCLEGGTQGASTAFGASRPFSAQAAAFANGTAAHAYDFDDNCYAGFVHGSAVIAPATLAVGQKVGASGAEAITAFAIGAECEYAFGAATRNALYERGWWTTGVLGPLGASMAAARLLGLDAARAQTAFGLALAGAGGMKACFGSDAKVLLAGRASEAGVVCAELAARGASGPARVVEEPNGFANLFNGGTFEHAGLAVLGRHWYLEDPGADVKRIPVCLSSHAAVDAVLELVEAHRLDAADIVSIVCDVPPVVRANLKYDRPHSVREAQFSMPFAIAAALRFPSFDLSRLDMASLADEALVALMARVSMQTSPIWDKPGMREYAPEGARVILTRRDGAPIEAFRDKARGSATDPLSADEIAQKFLACVSPVLGDRRAANLLARLEQLDGPVALRDLFADAGGPT